MAIILAAIPLFFLLIAIEIYVDRKRGTGYYQFNDAINSLQVGTLSRLVGLLKALVPFTLYVYVYENWRLLTVSDVSMLSWIFAFVIYDLGYYWVHRLSHRINIMWGSHVVHHSSEEYNLTTALRQTSTPALFGALVFIPLALIGISPMMLVACGSLNLVYQFWVHTRHVDKMPNWYEAIFVTPSHHRVHHALNRDYIDKNFAGVFILWDKWFGSFQAEKQEVNIVYGVSHQLKSWNPLWANCQVYLNLWRDSIATKNWLDKVLVWLKPPGWRPEDVQTSHPRGYVTTKTMKKFDVSLSLAEKRYVLFQHASCVLMAFSFLLALAQFTTMTMVLVSLFAIFSLYVISCLQERRSFARLLEAARLLATGVVVMWILPQTLQLTGLIGTSIYLLVSLFSLYLIHKNYDENEQVSLAEEA